MQAYIDDSMNDGEVLVFGGLISTAKDWELFSVEWRQYLHEERIRVFKLTRAAPRHAGRLYQVVCDHAKAALCFVVPIPPLKESAARYGLSETSAAKPYLWAYKGVINSLARNQREWGLYESVDFIFDDRPDQEKADVMDGWEVHRDTVPDEVRSIMGCRPTFADDKDVLPLQAADMWAGYCRRTWCENNGMIPEDGFPVPFGKRGDLPQLIQLWTEEDIDQELCRIAKDLGDYNSWLTHPRKWSRISSLDRDRRNSSWLGRVPYIVVAARRT